MSDEVVDRVMHRRGSIGLGWLEQPLTDRRAMCENTELRRFATSEVRDVEQTGA